MLGTKSKLQSFLLELAPVLRGLVHEQGAAAGDCGTPHTVGCVCGGQRQASSEIPP